MSQSQNKDIYVNHKSSIRRERDTHEVEQKTLPLSTIIEIDIKFSVSKTLAKHKNREAMNTYAGLGNEERLLYIQRVVERRKRRRSMNNADTEEQLQSTSHNTTRAQRTIFLLRAQLNSYEYEDNRRSQTQDSSGTSGITTTEDIFDEECHDRVLIKMMSTHDDLMDHPTPINSLKKFDKLWNIKVRVMRRGLIEKYNNDKGSGERWKVIVIDAEGTKIQAVIFNEAISKFKAMLLKDRTYHISNGLVKPVLPQYASVHNMELSLTTHTRIVESTDGLTLTDSIYDFVPLKKVIQSRNVEDQFDTIAFVLDVRTSFRMGKDRPPTEIREIIIKDIESDSVRLTLWGDLSENEGKQLEELITSNPIIAISRAKGREFEGEFFINSLTATTIEINPEIKQANELRQRQPSAPTKETSSASKTKDNHITMHAKSALVRWR
ncbi:hypothetical protein QJS10_CPB20g00749 [Acorus calamus]|uniref:Uncharacterized protein n=1 Tax=Acorus calamus TaxID=4465 RepID=A0AAV9CDD3_ACOCL|nr:hypothetical protein QJS10_CPB20g00749 [Acorus calamus]